METCLPVLQDAELITQPGYVYFDEISDGDKKIIRAQGGFHSRGCNWRKKNIEGNGIPSCHMFCPWPEMASGKGDLRGTPVQDNELLAQTDEFVKALQEKNDALAKNGGQVVERADLYIGGSHLNEEEMSNELLWETFKRISAVPGIATICIEARITDLTEYKLSELDKMAEAFGTKCIVAVGIETTNPDILKDAKKGISPDSIKKGFEKIMSKKNLIAQGYLLVKPAVMSEKASIDQAVEDLHFMADIAKQNPEAYKIMINMAPVAAMEGTGAALNDAYSAPSLWGVTEIIKRIGEDKDILNHIQLFFGLNTEGGNVEKEVTSCRHCDGDVRFAIETFNVNQKPSVMDFLPECECHDEWSEKLGKEPFLSGTVHYPYDPENPMARALYEQQIKGIMAVEKAFPEDIQASRETMEERIRSTGGKYQFIGYNPKNGRITTYFVTQLLPSEEIFKIDVSERGWERLSQIKPTPDGDVLEGISMGSLPDAPAGAARRCVQMSFDAVDNHGLTGLSGVIRLPGLSNMKNILESKLGRPISAEETDEMAKHYMEAHYKRFAEEKISGKLNKADITFNAIISGEEVDVSCEMDENLGFWGRMPHTRGTIVDSMEYDELSLGKGLWMIYEGKNAKKITSDTKANVERVLET